jgi:hypothetical protein
MRLVAADFDDPAFGHTEHHAAADSAIGADRLHRIGGLENLHRAYRLNGKVDVEEEKATDKIVRGGKSNDGASATWISLQNESKGELRMTHNGRMHT